MHLFRQTEKPSQLYEIKPRQTTNSGREPPPLVDLNHLFHDRGLLDIVQSRNSRFHVCVSLSLDRALIRLLEILAVDMLHNIHPFHHCGKRSKTLGIEELIALQIDK